jgi:hypothetical protein
MIGSLSSSERINKFFFFAAAAVMAFVFTAVSVPTRAGEEGDKVTLRYAPEEGKVYRYKADSRTKIYFGPYSFETITGQEVELSLLEKLENNNLRVAVKFDKSSTKMMRMGDLIEQEPRIKPEGRTVKVEVSPRGEVIEALGFIMGVKKGRALDNYMDKWFFELPEEPVGEGSTWTVPLDETSEEGDDEVYAIKGEAKLKLNKFDKKNGIEVAEIEAESKVEINSEKAESKQKVYIALEGGYIVEAESSTEVKGKMLGSDQSGQETESEITRVESDKIKLEK